MKKVLLFIMVLTLIIANLISCEKNPAQGIESDTDGDSNGESITTVTDKPAENETVTDVQTTEKQTTAAVTTKTPSAEMTCTSRLSEVHTYGYKHSEARVNEMLAFKARDISSFTEEEKALIEKTDKVMTDKFGITDLSCYKIEIKTYKNNPDFNYVGYTLYIYDYQTYESYHIYFLNGEADYERSQGLNAGQYSKYLPVSAVQLSISEEAIKDASHTDYFFIGDYGKNLTLNAEVIESDGESHVHVFYRVAVAEAVK